LSGLFVVKHLVFFLLLCMSIFCFIFFPGSMKVLA
jgi:hypothetical protein